MAYAHTTESLTHYLVTIESELTLLEEETAPASSADLLALCVAVVVDICKHLRGVSQTLPVFNHALEFNQPNPRDTSSVMAGRGVFIVAAKRTAFGTYGGKLRSVSPTELSAVASKAALAAGGVDPKLVDSVVIANVIHVRSRMTFP